MQLQRAIEAWSLEFKKDQCIKMRIGLHSRIAYSTIHRRQEVKTSGFPTKDADAENAVKQICTFMQNFHPPAHHYRNDLKM